MALKGKQQAFVQEYLIDLNASAAARRAGYSEKTADVIGHENLGKPEIAEAIAKAMKDREARTHITQDRVLQELARLAFADVRKMFNADGSLKPPQEIDNDTAAALAGIDTTFTSGGEGAPPVVTKKVKVFDKKGALELCMRHLGMFNDKLKLGGDADSPLTVVIRKLSE